MTDTTRALTGEALGTFLLVLIVVASGIAAESMSEIFALQLGLHALAVAAGLAALIVFLGPVSGAHFNPAVTLGFVIERAMNRRTAVSYVIAQIGGGILGGTVANAMFGMPWIEVSTQVRSGLDQVVSELIGTFVLVLLVLGLVRLGRIGPIAPTVALWVFAVILATPSYGFVNPAVTIARIFTDTFTGIAPESALPFVIAQLVAALAAAYLARSLYPTANQAHSQQEQERV